MIAAMMTITTMAQSDVYCWKNGVAHRMLEADSVTFTEPGSAVLLIATHEYVDLGLSVKWATCNVGATAPTEYGDYFAWGETTRKKDYSWDTYKFTEDGGSTFTKYNKTDGKTVLDKEDDVVAVNWGGEWRTPTLDEIKELVDNCTWEWQAEGNIAFNGVAGYKVSGKKAGYTDNYIFLPAGGSIGGGYRIEGAGQLGFYMSATRDSVDADHSWSIGFNSDAWQWGFGLRRNGRLVRPVCP